MVSQSITRGLPVMSAAVGNESRARKPTNNAPRNKVLSKTCPVLLLSYRLTPMFEEPPGFERVVYFTTDRNR